MPTITFDVPAGALSALRLSPAEFVKEMRVAAALLWYSHGELSQSKAVEIAGTSRADFINELGAHRAAQDAARSHSSPDAKIATSKDLGATRERRCVQR
jgi:hypothetical protein